MCSVTRSRMRCTDSTKPSRLELDHTLGATPADVALAQLEVAGERPRLEQRLELPALRPAVVVRAGASRGCARGRRPCPRGAGSASTSQSGGSMRELVDAAHGRHREPGGDLERPGVGEPPRRRLGDEDHVDVAHVVELAGAGLAHADDREPGRRDLVGGEAARRRARATGRAGGRDAHRARRRRGRRVPRRPCRRPSSGSGWARSHAASRRAAGGSAPGAASPRLARPRGPSTSSSASEVGAYSSAPSGGAGTGSAERELAPDAAAGSRAESRAMPRARGCIALGRRLDRASTAATSRRRLLAQRDEQATAPGRDRPRARTPRARALGRRRRGSERLEPRGPLEFGEARSCESSEVGDLPGHRVRGQRISRLRSSSNGVTCDAVVAPLARAC